MKLAIAMKSNFAYERLASELNNYELSQLSSIQDIQEAIQYYKPDIVILDQGLPFFMDAEKILLRFNIQIVIFESDFESVIQQVHSQSVFFTEEELEEKYIPDHTKYIEQLHKKVEKDTDEQPVIYKEKIVEKEVEKLSFTSIPQKVIIVGSLWSGAGSTTIVNNLARAIAKRGLQVSVIEHPSIRPYLFDYLDIHNIEDHKQGRTYFDHAQIIKAKGVVTGNRNWYENGISWYVNDSRYTPVSNFSYEEMLKLVYSVPTPIKIIDISTNWNDSSIQDFLHHADEIFVCIEPDPIKIDWLAQISLDGKKTKYQRTEYETIQFLNELENKEGINFQFITTKVTGYVNLKKWHEEFALKESLISLKNIPYQECNKAIWESAFLYDTEEYKALLESAFKPIFKRILPIEFQRIGDDTKEKNRSILSLKKMFSKSEVK